MVLVALGLDLLAAFSLQGFATDPPPYHKSHSGFLPILLILLFSAKKTSSRLIFLLQIRFNLIYSQNVWMQGGSCSGTGRQEGEDQQHCKRCQLKGFLIQKQFSGCRTWKQRIQTIGAPSTTIFFICTERKSRREVGTDICCARSACSTWRPMWWELVLRALNL